MRARERRRWWLRRHRGRVAVVAALALGLLAFETVWLLGLLERGPFAYYLLGAVHAGVVVAAVAAVHTVYLVHDGEGLHQLRGAWGEENTIDELRKARRRGVVWGAVHDVRLQVGDLDHVVVTRRGGVVVLDSKWRSVVSDDAPAELAARARRVRTRAEALVDTVAPRSARGRHRAPRLAVRPAVVVWGALASHVPDDFAADGVAVIAGNDLCAWLHRLEGDVVTEDKAKEFLSAVREFSNEVAAREVAARETGARQTAGREVAARRGTRSTTGA